MAYQVLQGITVTPKGNRNQSRFSSTLVDGVWPTSFGFGGWIYNSAVDIGYSNRPSEIKLSIVLEVINKEQKYATFDIRDDDLKCDAGNGGDESLFDFNFNGIVFTDFVLYEYDISIENSAKILTVTFKDYSIILDKIYIGLIKRQGNIYTQSSQAQLTFPIRCSDCVLQGSSFVDNGVVYRDISYGSYVGINGGVYDNFENIDPTVPIFQRWANIFSSPIAPIQFDLNGGYLIIGTEEATEELCGDLAKVAYNFNELLASLRIRGFNFTGAFPVNITDSDYVYKQNYIGTLREVLQQWCSDLAYDFYCDGKNFIGINLTKPIDISSVIDIADPTTTYGSQFALNQNTAIVSYKASTTLDNTFRQSVITANNRARDYKVDSKSPKRYIGILPMHPIDFNYRSNALVIRESALGTWFYDIAWANNFEINNANIINEGGTISVPNDRNSTLDELDGRTFGDIDTAIALTKYDATLRDIYCQDRALYGETADIRAANFKALGYVPLIEVTGEEMSYAIESLIPTAKDEVSNICLDKRFYRVFIGYYYSDFKQDIIEWERASADAMYKYGIVTNGLLNYYPYMPQNSLNDLSPTAGFYGQSGNSLLRIQHTVEPSCQQYFQLRDAPFQDIILYSGLITPSETVPIPLNPLDGQNILDVFSSGNLFPQGLFYATLDNDWGTEEEEFKRIMSLNLDDQCENEFQQDEAYTDIVNNIPKKFQDWRLDLFRPYETADIEEFYSDFITSFEKLENPQGDIFDRTISTYYNLRYKENATCSKLHIIVMTDTRAHPNVSISFNQYGTQFVNPVVLRSYIDKERQAVLRRLQTETLSVCSITLLQQMCDAILSGNFNSNTGDPQFRCIIDENKYNFLEDGFTFSDLLSPNSRGLGINITRNPIRNDDTDKLAATFTNSDINGDFYYSDILSNQLIYSQAQANMTIIYPVSFQQYAAYRGILTSQVDWENRIPEMVDILGEPTNTTNNNTSTIKVINNPVDPDLQPQLDPYLQRYLQYMTVITGTGQIITTVDAYHTMVSNLNNYQLTGAMKSVDLTLAGTPNDFGTFQQYLSPIYGLNKLSISVSDNGVTTSLSYSDRPKILPKQESILNMVGPRLIG